MPKLTSRLKTVTQPAEPRQTSKPSAERELTPSQELATDLFGDMLLNGARREEAHHLLTGLLMSGAATSRIGRQTQSKRLKTRSRGRTIATRMRISRPRSLLAQDTGSGKRALAKDADREGPLLRS
jgi:hypothetical protein